ncbi:MAG: biotin--[Lachnospiraceae bacterium]|nr:biotin--[acetyl-CoA-carboxylase] ligase [Lachnospiraceae bacterium]
MKRTKDKVFEILQSSPGVYLSGQEIADRLYVTRAAVWKAVRALQSDGMKIEAVTNRGYRLIKNTDTLAAERILDELAAYALDQHMGDDLTSVLRNLSGRICVHDRVESTNTLAKELANSEGPHFAVIIADEQTAGRGRRGRSFVSPAGCGIYMSILLKPDKLDNLATGFTCMMAVAACRAISQVLHLEAGIKWVNDLYLNDRKIAGILTEGTVSLEDNTISDVIIGIGINVYTPAEGLPDSVKNIAGSLLGQERVTPDLRNRLCAAVIAEFFRIYKGNGIPGIIDEYRMRSVLIGQYVRISDFSGTYRYAVVEGIDDTCHLLVRYENGKTEALSSGEVSVAKY